MWKGDEKKDKRKGEGKSRKERERDGEYGLGGDYGDIHT